MLTEQTFQLLSSMRMLGFSRALRQQLDSEGYGQLSFEERIAMLVDTEYADRESRKLTRRLQHAKLREKACLEDIDFGHPRGLDKATVRRLATCHWVGKHQNVILTGPTGVGKTYIACALADQVCRDGMTAIYRRMPRLLHELLLARADGSYSKLLARIAKMDVLVIDDRGIAPLADQERRDLLEVLEDRHGARSTIVATQLPIDSWHGYIGEPTIADAILDRLVHNAHRLELKGASLRKKRSNLTTETKSTK